MHAGDFSDEELDDFTCCSCAHMDEGYDYDDCGLTEEQMKQLSMKRARDMLAKSCTVEDKLGDIATVRWTIRHRFKLPELVKELILSFYPTAQIQLRGQKLLGLHNGRDYFFKGLATARAGDLMCDYKNQNLSVLQYFSNMGCPVSPAAPVIKASRCFEDLDFCEEVAVLPSEFAVLVPQTSFPCSSSRGSFFDFFDREDWFDDDDAQIFDLSEEEMESEEEIESDGPSISAPAPKVRKIEKPWTQVSREILPQDRELYFAVERSSDVREDGKDVRQLLCDGANPTVPIRLPWKLETERSAVSFAKDLVESWTNFQEELQKHQLCPHQARDWKSVHCSFLYVSSNEEAEELAQMFLEELEMKKHFVALLTAAESVWINARPSKGTLCSDNFLCGRGVICPDFELLRARLAELKVPDVSMICEEDVCRLAACMWDLAQKRQAFGKHPKTLCCRKAEGEAMTFEENVSRKVELMERRQREKLARQLQFKILRLQERRPNLHLHSEMSSCSACCLNLPNSAFSKSQLSKGRRRRCSSCIACSILPGEAVSPWLTFDTCQGAWKFPHGLMQFLRDAGYSAPTTLQAYLWPTLIEGRDIVAIAKSGTGKTLSYLLPGFIKVARAAGNSNSRGPRMLVMVPTRELWQQIRSESERFGRPANITTAGVFGAVSVESASGQQCLVTTPAHLNSSTGPAIDASGCQYLVMDQLDQMLNMGFEAQLLELPACLPQVRQTAVYTTAWSDKIQSVARQLTKDALCVQVQ
eukprot:s56_g37.t1